MKRLLYILLLVISWNTLTAQTYQVNNQKIRFMNALGIPAKDTAAANWANASDTSIILIRPGDSTLWYKYKGDFRKVGTGGGTAIVDTVNTISSKPWRQKGDDSVSALISPRITDSLRLLVRLRASGSGGIQLQNSVGTNVADFGIANTTNGSIVGGWNVGGNLSVTGTSGFTGKATFSDSIVGVNQRLSNSMTISNDLTIGDDLTVTGSASFNGGVNFNSSVSTSGQTYANFIADGNNTIGGGALYLRRQGSTHGFVGVRGAIEGNSSTGLALFAETGYEINLMSNGSTTPRLTVKTDGSTSISGALTATAQGNNITVGVDSSVTSTSYTLVLGDAGYLKRCSNASAITITVPTNASVAFPIGTTIYFSQQGAGKVSVSPATSDVTIQSEGGLLGTAGQHAVIGLIKVNTNRWLLVGNRG